MNLEIPQWAIRLLPSNGELIRLKDDDFQRLKAYLPSKPRRTFTVLKTPPKEQVEQFNTMKATLWTLLEYNRQLREREGQSNPPIGKPILPTTVEEAIAQGYVESKVIHSLLSDRFGNPSKLTAFLNDSKRKDKIRQFRPNLNRRMVHAADFLQVLFEEQEQDEAARSRIDGDKPPRRNKPLK